jgi:ribonuclease HI
LIPLKVTVHVDGGSRGNPGPAAAAAVVSDESGNPLAERSRYIGKTTNNVAEYEAVLLALELAQELGASEVEVVNDSELVARQIGGEYRVKQEHLKPLYRKVMEALRGFDAWAVRSVRREHNVRADELVNEELDARRR